MRFGAAWVAALALTAPLCAAAGTWTHRGELSVGYDDNIGNSGSPPDRRGSKLASVGTTATFEQRYGRYTAVQTRVGVGLSEVFDLAELTSARLSGHVRLLHKPGRGFRTPVFGATLAAGARESGSDIRDGFDYRAGLSASAPLTTVVQARAEVWRSRRVATRGRVFDLDSTSYAVSFDWIATPSLLVYAGLRLDDGEFTVTAEGEGVIVPKTEHLYLQPRARAIEADPVFGDDWWAFGVEGQTLVATAGVNVPLNSMMALDLQLQRGEAHMDRFSYIRNIASLGVLVRW